MSSAWSRPAWWASASRATHSAAVANSDPVPGLAGADRQPDGQVGLAGAGRAEEHHVVLGGDEVQGAQVRDDLAFEAAGVVEVELLQATCGPGTGRRGCGPRRRGTRGRRPRAAGRRPGTPRGSRTRRGPARPAGAPTRAAWVPSAPGSGTRARRSGPAAAVLAAAITPPPVRAGAQRGVVVGQAAELDLGLGAAGGRPSTRWRRSAVAAARCAGSVMVWCQAQTRSWSATILPVAEHPDPGQVRGDLDPAADHRRVDRVVVGVQPHVVVAGQPRRRTATRSPARPAAAAASRPCRRRSGRPGAQPSARRRPGVRHAPATRPAGR